MTHVGHYLSVVIYVAAQTGSDEASCGCVCGRAARALRLMDEDEGNLPSVEFSVQADE